MSLKKIDYLKGSVLGSLTLLFAIGLTSGCASKSVKKELSKEERAGMLVDLANGALSEGDPTGALQALAEAEQLDPNNAQLHHSKALAYFGKKNISAALEEGRKAVALSPKDANFKNTLGKLLMDAGQYGEAELPLKDAAGDPLYRDAYKAHTNLGILYYRQGDDSQALTHLNRVVELYPTQSCIAEYYRGYLHLKKGEFDRAVQSYDRATQRLCAGFADAHLALGIAYERSGQFERARKKFLEVKQSFPNTKTADQAMDRLKYLP